MKNQAKSLSGFSDLQPITASHCKRLDISTSPLRSRHCHGTFIRSYRNTAYGLFNFVQVYRSCVLRDYTLSIT